MSAPPSVASRVLSVVDRVLDRVEHEHAQKAEAGPAGPAPNTTDSIPRQKEEIHDHLSQAS